MIEFRKWPKIPRLENEKYYFTEKIDGTNSAIVIDEDGNFACQSRTRFITPDDDNFGFARWAYENKDELLKLGPGHHYGEWWGKGINRGYESDRKIFSLFNTAMWGEHNPDTPGCVSVVPVLRINSPDEVHSFFKENGSIASPGFMRPEGAVMFSYLTRSYYKIILDK